MLKSWGEKYLVFYHRKYLFVLCARCLQQKMLLRMKVYKVVTVLYKNLYSISVIKKPYLIRLYVFIMKNNVSSIWFYCSQNFELFCFPIFRFWAYPMKVILSVPNEGYSERTQWRLFWAYPMKVILSVPNEGYFERTQWRLFQRRTMPTKFDIYAFIVIDILCLVYIIF